MSKRIRVVKSPESVEPYAMSLGDLTIYGGIKKTRLRKFIKSGKLRAFRVGGTFLVVLDDFKNFLEQHRYQPDLNKIVDEVMEGMK